MENTTTSLASVIEAMDFSILTENILSVIGASAGVVLTLIAIRKGWGFLKSTIKKA